MDMQGVPLIPRRVFFGNPDRASVQLSPDGSWISYLAPLDGVLNLWVAPRGDVGAARAVTHDTGRGIRLYQWAFTSDRLLYLQDQDGDENWRLYDVASGGRDGAQSYAVRRGASPDPGRQRRSPARGAGGAQPARSGVSRSLPAGPALGRVDAGGRERGVPGVPDRRRVPGARCGATNAGGWA